jgi:hypothetical protein
MKPSLKKGGIKAVPEQGANSGKIRIRQNKYCPTIVEISSTWC